MTMELTHICQHTDSSSSQHKKDLMSSLLKKCNSFDISKEMTERTLEMYKRDIAKRVGFDEFHNEMLGDSEDPEELDQIDEGFDSVPAVPYLQEELDTKKKNSKPEKAQEFVDNSVRQK